VGINPDRGYFFFLSGLTRISHRLGEVAAGCFCCHESAGCPHPALGGENGRLKVVKIREGFSVDLNV
jgi:hypothetical protein